MGEARQPLVTPAGRLWLAVGGACTSTALLGAAFLLLTFATLFDDSCGEDLRWVALAVATALASLAALVGLLVAGLSLRPAADGGGRRWTTTILTVTAVAWAVAALAPWLPHGTCT